MYKRPMWSTARSKREIVNRLMKGPCQMSELINSLPSCPTGNMSNCLSSLMTSNLISKTDTRPAIYTVNVATGASIVMSQVGRPFTSEDRSHFMRGRR